MEKKQFLAESQRLLDLMINSIYTHKEIFLREIISNASDAIDKLCYLSLTDDKVGMTREDFRIKVTVDEDARQITVADNGIGMTRDELEQNLGVIARSGSSEFRSQLESSPEAEVDIIGQFGVGFYSAFMVSEQVTVRTRAYGSESGFVWESTGADGYTIEECGKDSVGTEVIMKIKPDTDDENYGEFLAKYRIRSLIKKYSDYVRWPIVMDNTKSVPRETGETDDDGEPVTEYDTVTEEETVNSMIPIWQRSKSEVSDDDCKAYYKEKYFDDPAKVIRVNAEGTVSYKAMLFIPEKAPYDFYTRDFKYGLTLYSSGVLIMEYCTDLIPECFRFVRGIVDSPDLSLNISREVLQHDRQLRVIAANLEKKVKQELKKMLENEREQYEKVYGSFGLQLKYGIVSGFGQKKELLEDLILFHSCEENRLISLEEYAKKMPEGQQYIYYACAETAARAASLPQTENVRVRGYDILCLTQDVDEFAVQVIAKYADKEFRNVNSEDLGLEDETERQETEKKETELKDLFDFMKERLGERVHAVKLSHKLRSHPVCLGTEGDVSLEMEKYFASLPDDRAETVKAKRVLELNGSHSVMDAISAAYETDKDRAGRLTEVLYNQALLIAGLPLEDPAAYTELICGLF